VVLAGTPVTENSVPVTETPEIVTFVFPLFVRVAPKELLPPSETSPKLRFDTLEVRSVVDAAALAVAEIMRGELAASLVSETDPDTLPAELGEKTRLKVAFCPAAIFAGTARPATLNPAPVTLAVEIVASAEPVFATVMVCELLEPIVTFGKFAALGLADS
jgi:hypothetical protein